MDVSDLFVICGFGVLGVATGRELRRRGVAATNISVIDIDHVSFEEARKLGFRAISGDAADAGRLRVAGVGAAERIVVCVGDIGATAVTRAARELAPSTCITTALHTGTRREVVLAAGATEVIVLAKVAGEMLAASVES